MLGGCLPESGQVSGCSVVPASLVGKTLHGMALMPLSETGKLRLCRSVLFRRFAFFLWLILLSLSLAVLKLGIPGLFCLIMCSSRSVYQ